MTAEAAGLQACRSTELIPPANDIHEPKPLASRHVDAPQSQTPAGALCFMTCRKSGVTSIAVATPEQMAHDVTMFLTWAAEPKLEARKRIGFKVISYLIILSFLLYFTNRRIWKDTH